MASMNTGAMKRLSIWFVIFPLIALATVLPMILYLPPLFWPDNVNTLQFIAAAPFWIGVAAGPGYLYAWNGHYRATLLPPLYRGWVRFSLFAALIASITGTVVRALAILPVPFAVGSAVCSLLLLRRFNGAAG